MRTMDELHPLEFVKDEYGNFYEITSIKSEYGKLTYIELSHAYYEISFQRLMYLDGEEKEKYGLKHIGVFLQDIINDGIQSSIEKYGKIYSVKELKDADVNVVFKDITQRHPRSKPIIK